MIKVGTVCLLKGNHGHAWAGHCCVVIGPLEWVEYDTDLGLFKAWAYSIELSNGARTNSEGLELGAMPSELIPISDPDATDTTRTPETVSA